MRVTRLYLAAGPAPPSTYELSSLRSYMSYSMEVIAINRVEVFSKLGRPRTPRTAIKSLKTLEFEIGIMEDSPCTVAAAEDYFASPPEPVFNQGKNGLSVELLQDSLKLLASKNEVTVHAEHKEHKEDFTSSCFKKGQPVQFIFELCKHFDLSSEVQYKAAELFHLFMISHIKELFEHVNSSSTTSSPINWDDVEGRLKHQIILRAVSCVQLASKLGSHYHLVTLNRAKSFLILCGFRYASTSLVQSEVRVLKTLKFQVHQPTPLEFIEALLGALGHNDKSIPVKQLHGLTLKVLDVFYLQQDKIYSRLETSMELPHDKKSSAMAAVKVDLMLLGTSVIATAAFILNCSQSEVVTSLLSEITCIMDTDILNFASILLEEILDD